MLRSTVEGAGAGAINHKPGTSGRGGQGYRRAPYQWELRSACRSSRARSGVTTRVFID